MVETKTELENFCRNVAYIHRKLALSKAQMAKTMGIGIATLDNIEKGVITKRAGVSIFFEMYDNLGVSPATLLSDDTEQINRELNYYKKRHMG